MSKIELGYAGQEHCARKYLVSREDYGADKVAIMSSSDVAKAINKIADDEEMTVVYQDRGQDIGLVPKEVVSQIKWFSR